MTNTLTTTQGEDMKINLEFENWHYSSTEDTYPEGSLVHFHSLGEEAYGVVILTPSGEFYLEEITAYGSYTHTHGQVKSLQEALKTVSSWT